MDKIAQRRGIFNKLREKINSPGESLIGAFSPEFTQLMDKLRDVDEKAREDAADLKGILKTAKSSFNRREYMTSIAYLGEFHDTVDKVIKTLKGLNNEANAIHNEFLFGDIEEKHKNYLFNQMPEKFKQKAKPASAQKADDGNADDSLEKEAGVKDWWHNLTSDRGQALKHWEKRFPKQAKEIKRQTERMINRSEVFLNILQGAFKQLASFRATRKLEEYMKVVESFESKFNSYDASFNEYFNSTVKKYIDSKKEFDQTKKETERQKSFDMPEEKGSDKKIDLDLPSDGTPAPVGTSAPGVSPMPFPKTDEVSQSNIPIDLQEVPTPSQRITPVVPSDASQRPTPIIVDPNANPIGATDMPASSAIPKAPAIPKFTYPPAESISPEQARINLQTNTILPAKNKTIIPPTPAPTPSKFPAVHRAIEDEVLYPKMTPQPGGTPYSRRSTDEFLNKIIKMSDTVSPSKLALEIFRFAKTIENDDKQASEQLNQIAKSLIQ
jgi:hypothetical protein